MAFHTKLNPLRVLGTQMQPNLLLMAKIIALALLCTNHVRLLPDPFLPFLAFIDQIPGEPFQLALKIAFLAGIAALLLNLRVRVAAIVLGAAILAGVVSSKAYYGNNKAFCGVVLLLAGLTDSGAPPLILRWQFSLVYFGAGLNKLLDADWQSGLFFEYWATVKIQDPIFKMVSPLLPPLVAGKIMCWFTIVAELATSAGLQVPKVLPYALWMNILFQAGLLEFTGTTFTMFFYGMQAATLIFIVWPRHLTVLYDGDCGICNKIRQGFTWLDSDGLLRWRTYQSGAGNQYGISEEALAREMYVVDDQGRQFAGFHAFKRIMYFQPWFWLTLTVLIALPPDGWHLWRRVIVGGTLTAFMPVFNACGEWVYAWVARNRRSIMPNSTCGLDRNAP